MRLKLAFSPCPNDTFAFHAMVHGLVDTHDFQFDVTLADIEDLNKSASNSVYDITKMSYSAYMRLCDKYIMLNSGSALGFNNGPLLVKRAGTTPNLESAKVAIPGLETTANLLASILFPQITNKSVYIFSNIEDAILNEEVEAGLLIHEGRFTYKDKGLELIADLGEVWQKKYNLPIPLGGIAIKRTLIDAGKDIDSILKSSIDFAFKNPNSSSEYIKSNAQEMEERVQRDHIMLYVNEFTKDIGKDGKKAVEMLYKVAAKDRVNLLLKCNKLFI